MLINRDLIKRQDAINAIYGITSYKGTIPLESAIFNIQKVPSAERKGKWNFIGDQMYECTECGVCYTQDQFYQMRVRITDTEFPKFCPNCGARMVSE